MSLKRGDLCFVVGDGALDPNRDKVVTVVKPLGDRIYEWPNGHVARLSSYEVEPPLINAYGDRQEIVPESYLRKIDNPGDDAVDESVAWLPPVPQLETV